LIPNWNLLPLAGLLFIRNREKEFTLHSEIETTLLARGLATAQQFVYDGAYVFIVGRRQNEVDTAVNQIGKNVTGVQVKKVFRLTN
jgi:hypothetical protein